MDNRINASEIAEFLNSQLIGNDIEIKGVCAADMMEDGKITFLKENKILENPKIKALIIVRGDKKIEPRALNSYIKVPNPRLAFAKVVDRFFVEKREAKIKESAKIGENVIIGEGVTIGENCVIEDNVTIGRRTVINHNVVIAKNIIIGENCYIKSGAVIGEDGFGIDFEEDGAPVRIPHLGRVVIHNNVEIGSNCTVPRATIRETVIFDNVKLSDQVHLGHNCVIGKNTIISAQVQISGSVMVGENCNLGANCSILNKVKIGNNVKIGIGAVVRNDVKDNKIVLGLEALPLKDLLKLKKRIGYHDDKRELI